MSLLPADGIGGIGDEVHDHLLDLGPVGLEQREFRGQLEVEADLLGQGGSQEPGHLLNDGI